MKIINAVGPQLPGMIVGMAQQKATTLQRIVTLRPYKKTFLYTTDTTQDIYIIIIQLGQSPSQDRITIVNGNEFRITSAVNEDIGGLLYPTVTWKGGIPPYVVKLQWHNPALGGFMDDDTTGRVININPNLTDGVGDIVTAGMAREYIIERVIDADTWWADDLDGEFPQDAIGLSITDSSNPPRVIFAPFRPLDTSPLIGIYNHYGPGPWCLPPVAWSDPAPIIYGTPLSAVQLNATARIPGTADPLDGTFTYDPPTGTILDASSGTVLSVQFQALDEVHYHLVTEWVGLIISKANQSFTNYNPPAKVKRGELVNMQIMDYDQSLNPAPVITAISDNPAVIAVTGNHFISYDDPTPGHSTWKVWNLEIQGMGGGRANVAVTLEGTNNYNAKTISVQIFGTFALNEIGGVTFEINDSPIYFGEALDGLTAAPIAGIWEIDPPFGSTLFVQPLPYSVTAVFHPTDSANYPDMEYDLPLTVLPSTPDLSWNPPAMTYGQSWSTATSSFMAKNHFNPAMNALNYGIVDFRVNGSSINTAAVPSAVNGGEFVDAYFMATNGGPAGVHQYNDAVLMNTAVEINKAMITFHVQNATKVYGTPNPGFGGYYSGLVNGDNAGVISGEPSMGTVATQYSNVGNYQIWADVAELSAVNYDFESVGGTLTITPAANNLVSMHLSPATIYVGQTATIVWDSVNNNAGAGTTFIRSSGNTNVATVPSNSDVVTGVGPGTANIFAMQSGGTNYYSGSDYAVLTVVQSFNGSWYNGNVGAYQWDINGAYVTQHYMGGTYGGWLFTSTGPTTGIVSGYGNNWQVRLNGAYMEMLILYDWITYTRIA